MSFDNCTRREVSSPSSEELVLLLLEMVSFARNLLHLSAELTFSTPSLPPSSSGPGSAAFVLSSFVLPFAPKSHQLTLLSSLAPSQLLRRLRGRQKGPDASRIRPFETRPRSHHSRRRICWSRHVEYRYPSRREFSFGFSRSRGVVEENINGEIRTDESRVSTRRPPLSSSPCPPSFPPFLRISLL